MNQHNNTGPGRWPIFKDCPPLDLNSADSWPALPDLPPLDITAQPPLDLNADLYTIPPPEDWPQLDLTAADSQPALCAGKGAGRQGTARPGETLNGRKKGPQGAEKQPTANRRREPQNAKGKIDLKPEAQAQSPAALYAKPQNTIDMFTQEITPETPLVQMTAGQLAEYLNARSTGNAAQPGTGTAGQLAAGAAQPRRYVYGIKGIMQLFGVSNVTAQRYKKGIIKEAVSQNGRIIVVDEEKALQLFKQRKAQ